MMPLLTKSSCTFFYHATKVKENSGHQVLDKDVQSFCNTSKGSEMQASTVVEIERNVIYVDSLSTSKNM